MQEFTVSKCELTRRSIDQPKINRRVLPSDSWHLRAMACWRSINTTKRAKSQALTRGRNSRIENSFAAPPSRLMLEDASLHQIVSYYVITDASVGRDCGSPAFIFRQIRYLRGVRNPTLAHTPFRIATAYDQGHCLLGSDIANDGQWPRCLTCA